MSRLLIRALRLLPCVALVCAMALLLPQAMRAQQPAAAGSAALSGIAHVAIRVRDLDASVAFYQKLGFVRAFALSRAGKVYEAFLKINDHQFLELYPQPEHGDAKAMQLGFLHLCFYGNDLQAAHDFYVAHGLTPNAVRTAGAGNLLFTMPGPMTPSGPQNMEYTQYMPASMHSKAVGQFLGPDRISTQMIAVTLAVDDPSAAAAFYIDKAGFLPTGSTRRTPIELRLPGAPSESVVLVPAESLGLKARITLAARPKQAAAELQQRGLAFTRSRHAVTVLDPDGNQIVLQ